MTNQADPTDAGGSPERRPGAATIVARAGTHARPGLGTPLVPALQQSTVHTYESLVDLDSVMAGGNPGHVYYRFGHYNGQILEAAVAELEGAPDAVCGASEMAVLSAGLLAVLSAGDHIVADRNAYGGTLTLLTADLPSLGITTTFVDADDLDAVRAAITPQTRVLLVEALSNPTMRVADLPALADVSRSADLVMIVDATFASPALIRPLDHGADLVVHSIPKYLGGHSAAMGGVAAGGTDLVTAARTRLVHLGATLGPFDAWMALLGLKTLTLRMTAHTSNAQALAATLAGHRAVSRVDHPAQADHPHRQLAARLYPDGTGGMLSFELPGGRDTVERFITGLVARSRCHPASPTSPAPSPTPPATHRNLDIYERLGLGITDGLIRLSVGIEDIDDLTDEITDALDEL